MKHRAGLVLCVLLGMFAMAAGAAGPDTTVATTAAIASTTTGQATADAAATEPKPAFSLWFAERRKQAAAAGLTPRGLVPETPETGERGTWSIPVPEINPLGAQKLYTKGTGYKKAGGLKLSVAENGTLIQRSLSGESWTLSFAVKQGDVLPFLKEYVQKIGGELLSGLSDDGFAFHVTKPDGVWWCDVSAESRDRADLRILRQPVLPLNTELKVTKAQFGPDGVFRCVANVPGRSFLLLECSLSNGAITLAANNDQYTREGMTLIRFRKYPEKPQEERALVLY